MPPVFVDILNLRAISTYNEKIIAKALSDHVINKFQAHYLRYNNKKWYDTCNHKGLLYIEDGKYYFITRTSFGYTVELPKYSKVEPNSKQIQKADILSFNDHCKIVNKTWVLGTIENSQISFSSLEGRPEVIARLVGTSDDLSKLKIWVKTLDLPKYDISGFFDIHNEIHEFEIINLSKKIIKDE